MVTVKVDPYSQAPVFVKMCYENTELAFGTAFFYRRDGHLYLISNWHNFSGRNPETKEPISSHGGIPDNIKCYTCLNLPHIKREWLEFPLYRDGKPLWFQHPIHGSSVDVAALPVVLEDKFRAIVLNDLTSTPMNLEVSHDVFVLGYPLGLKDEWASYLEARQCSHGAQNIVSKFLYRHCNAKRNVRIACSLSIPRFLQA